MASTKVTAVERAKIARLAEKILNEGAHFLNSAKGAKPGESDGPGNREVKFAMQSLDPSKPMLLTAKRGKHICEGRHFTVKGGVSTSPEAMTRYLNSQKLTADDYGPMYIRSYRFRGRRPGIIYTPRTSKGEIIIGEACGDKRHFDCIGFVNYCFWKVLGVNWSYNFKQYLKNFESSANKRKIKLVSFETYLEEFKDTDNSIKARDLKPGDVLIRIKGEMLANGAHAQTNHSGICFRDANGKIKIANCSSASTGVIVSKYDRKVWPHRIRVKI